MHRLFFSTLRTVSQALRSPAFRSLAPLPAQPVRFFSSSAPPYNMEHELRALVKKNAERRAWLSADQYYRLEGSNDTDHVDASLTAKELLVITSVLERIKEKYGVRCIITKDASQKFVVVMAAEKWINDEVLPKGSSLEATLIEIVRRMVPTVPCSGIEDLIKIFSTAPVGVSETNEASPENSI